jgi:hypothetical protein
LIVPFYNNASELQLEHNIFVNIQKQLRNEQYKYVQKFSSIYSFNIDNFLYMMKQVHIAVSTRLHCNIISNSLLIPTINIAYGIKSINYSVTNNLTEYTIPTYSLILQLDKIKAIFHNIQNNYTSITNHLLDIRTSTENKYINSISNLFKQYSIENYTKYNIILKTQSDKTTIFDIAFQ